MHIYNILQKQDMLQVNAKEGEIRLAYPTGWTVD